MENSGIDLRNMCVKRRRRNSDPGGPTSGSSIGLLAQFQMQGTEAR